MYDTASPRPEIWCQTLNLFNLSVKYLQTIVLGNKCWKSIIEKIEKGVKYVQG